MVPRPDVETFRVPQNSGAIPDDTDMNCPRRKSPRWKKELTKQSRRMERAIRGDRDDYMHFLELAYGVKGRFGHLMRRFEEERKIEKTRRQEKFLLKPIDEETMETFSVKNLVKMVEDTSLREGRSLRNRWRF